MATKIELLSEAYKRGILPEDKKPLFAEAVRRGLIPDPGTPSFDRPGSIPSVLGRSQPELMARATQEAQSDIEWREAGRKLVPLQTNPDGSTEYGVVDAQFPAQLNPSEKQAIIAARRQNLGLDPVSDQTYEQMSGQIRAATAADNSVLENFGGSAAHHLATIGTGLVGTVAPQTAMGLQQNIDQSYLYDPESKAAFAGGVVGNTLPLIPALAAGPAGAAVIGDVTAATLGASQFGSVRAEVAARRARGEQVSVNEELFGAAVSALAEFGGEKIGLSAITANRPYFVNAIAQRLMNYATTAGVNATEEMVTQVAQNAVDRYVLSNQDREIDEGVFEAGLTGGLVGAAGRGISEGFNRTTTPAFQQEPKAVVESADTQTAIAGNATASTPAPAPTVQPASAVAVQPDPIARELTAELPDLPENVTTAQLIEFAKNAGYNVSHLEGRGQRIVRSRLAEQKMQTAAKRVMTAQRSENVQSMAEQRQLPPESTGYDAGQLRRFARENNYSIDERRVGIDIQRGTKPREAVRQQIEEQYALPKGEGLAGELSKVLPTPKAEVVAVEEKTAEIGLPKIPASIRRRTTPELHQWLTEQGYKAGNLSQKSGRPIWSKQRMLKQAAQQRYDSQIPNLPRPPRSARSWTYKQMKHWATRNGFDVGGVEGIFSLRKVIKSQRSAALKQVRSKGKPASGSVELSRVQKELETERQLRRTDPLTGSPNRVAYDEDAARIIRDADSKGEHLAISESDLGNFKVVNDELGHEIGDQILKAQGEALRQGLRSERDDRPGDIGKASGYRTGGDESSVILRNVSDPGIAQTALERVSKIFDAKVAKIIGDKLPKEAYPFISWGISIRRPKDTRSLSVLRHQADKGTERPLGPQEQATDESLKIINPHSVMSRKSAIKKSRGIPEGREELKLHIERIRKQTVDSTAVAIPVAKNVTPIEGTAHKRSLVKRTLEYLGTPIIGRIRDLSPRLYRRLVEHELEIGVARENEKRLLVPAASRVVDALGGPKSEQYQQWSIHVLNGEFDAAKAMLPDDARKSFDTFEESIDRLLVAQKAAGVNVGTLKNYWPRVIKDYESFDAIYGDDKGRFEDAWDLAAAATGRTDITDTEKVEIANAVLAGHGPLKPGGTGPAHVRERQIEAITADQLRFYADPFAALMRYIDAATLATARARFLGKSHNVETMKDSIGQVVQQEVDAGHLNKAQQKEVISLLHVRLTADMLQMSSAVRNLKQATYLATLGQVRSAMTQITDLVATASSHGIGSTTKALFHISPAEKRLVMEDLGVHSHGEEFRDVGMLAKATDRALKMTGFTAMDRLGKETRINAALSSFQNAVNNPTSDSYAEFKRNWESVFGNEFAQLVSDLKAGRKTDLTRTILLADLMKVQPVTLSNMPEKYLRMRNGRFIYAMKTFMVQQIDFVRREMVRDLMTGGRRLHGLKKLSSFIALFTLLGMGKDLMLDLLRGKEINADQMPERAINPLLGIVGLNTYAVKQFADKPYMAALNFVAPPLSWTDKMWADVTSFGDGEGFNSLRYMPVLGEPFYYWFGKGADLNAQEAKQDYRSRLADLWQDAYLARQSGDMDTARSLLAIYNDRRTEGPGDGRNSPLTVADLSFIPPAARNRKADLRNKKKAAEALRSGDFDKARGFLAEYNEGRKNKLTLTDLRSAGLEDE